MWRREGKKTRAVRRRLIIFTLKIINLWAYYKPHGPTVEHLQQSHLIWMKLSHNSVTKMKYIFWITLESRPSTAKRKQTSTLKKKKKDTEFRYTVNPTKKPFHEFIMISERKLVLILYNFQRKHAFLTFYSWHFLFHLFTTTLLLQQPILTNNKITTVARQKKNSREKQKKQEDGDRGGGSPRDQQVPIRLIFLIIAHSLHEGRKILVVLFWQPSTIEPRL